MSGGQDAVRRILEAARREEVIAAALVARALTVSQRKLLRDWRRRGFQKLETHVGRAIFLPSHLVIPTYFPATHDHSGQMSREHR